MKEAMTIERALEKLEVMYPNGRISVSKTMRAPLGCDSPIDFYIWVGAELFMGDTFEEAFEKLAEWEKEK